MLDNMGRHTDVDSDGTLQDMLQIIQQDPVLFRMQYIMQCVCIVL